MSREAFSVHGSVSLDMRDTLAKLEKLDRNLTRFEKATPQLRLKLDDGKSQAKMDALLRQARDLQKASSRLSVSADTISARKSLGDVVTQIEYLKKNARITVTVSGGAARVRNTPVGNAPLTPTPTAMSSRLTWSDRGVSTGQLRIIKDWNSALAEDARLTKAAAREADRLATSTRNLGESARGANSWMSRTRSTTMDFVKAHIVIAGLAKAWELAKGAVVDYNAQQQRVLTSLEGGLGGSASKAKALLTDLQKQADVSAFREMDFTQTANKFLAAKIPIDEIKNALRGVDEQASRLGGDSQKFAQISTALNQIWIKPRLGLEELTQQLVEHGVPAFDLLAKAYGTNTTEIQKWISQGMIPGKEAARALWNQMERENFGSAAKGAKTFSGAIGNLADRLNRSLGSASKKAFAAVNELLNRLDYLVQNKEFQQWVEQAGSRLRTFANIAGKIAVPVIGVLGARFLWLGGVAVVTAMRSGLAAVMAFATGTGGALLVAAAPLLILAAKVALFSVAYKRNFLGIKTATDFVINGVVDAWKGLARLVAKAVDFVLKPLEWLKSKIPKNIQAKLGIEGWDFGGFEKATEAGLAELDKGGSALRASVQKNLSFDGLKDAASNSLKSVLGGLDISKWMQGYDANAALGKMPDAYKPKLAQPDAEKAAKKAADALKKLNLDQLQDTEKMYNAIADAAERTAKKQIDAINGVRDALRGFFEGMQSSFAEQGKSSALDGILAKYERVLNLGGRKTGIINSANATISSARFIAGQAASQRDSMQGGDGNNPQYTSTGGSGRAPSWLVAMERDSGKVFGRNCAEEIKARLKSFGITSVGSLRAASTNRALRVGFDENGRLPAGTIVRYPPGMAGSGRVGHRYGHYQAVGSNQQTWTESNVVGRDRISTSRSIDWARLQRDVQAGRALAYAPRGALNANAVSSATSSNRSSLASPVGSRYAGAFDMSLQKALETDNDGKLSTLGKLPKEWGPELAKNEKNTNRFAAQIFLLTKEGQNFARDWKKAGRSLKEFRADMNALDALDNKLKNSKAFGDRKREQSLEYAQNIKNGNLGLARDAKELERAMRLRGRENNPLAVLNERLWGGEFKGLNKKAVNNLYDATRRTMAADESKALNAANKELRDRQSLLSIESDVLRSGRMNQTQLNDALEVEAYRRQQVAELLQLPGMKGERAVALAKERAELFRNNRELERANALTRELMNSRAAAGAAVALSRQMSGIYSSTQSGSIEQDRALAYAQKLSELNSGPDLGYDTEDSGFMRDFKKTYDANLQTELDRNASTANLGARNALLAIENQLSQKSLEINGKLSDVLRQEMEWSLDKLQRAGTTNEVTDEELAKRRDILGVMRQISELDYTKTIGSLSEQLEALKYKSGDARDVFLRQRDLMRDPNLTDPQRAEIMRLEAVLKKANEVDARMTSLSTSIHDGLTGAFKGVATKGLSSFGSLFDGAIQRFDEWSAKILSDAVWKYLSGALFGDSGSGGLLGGLLGGILGGGGGTPGIAGAAAGAITGGDGSALWKDYGNISGGLKLATGMPTVPRDNLPALLHRGEAVLTATQAHDWRAQQREFSGVGRRSSTRGGNRTVSIGNITVNGVTNAEDVPREIERHFAGRGVSRGEMMREAAQFGAAGSEYN